MGDGIDFKEIRELAGQFSITEIEGCINEQLETGGNRCKVSGHTEKVINELSKAQFIKAELAKGTILKDAIRELARRIRQVQAGFESST